MRRKACPDKRRAKKRGSKFYFTGEPCDHGHYSKRYTSSGACVECMRLGNIGNPFKGRLLKARYGIEIEEYNAIIRAQDNKCACCGVPLKTLKKRQIHLDHCKVTGAVRGVLCFNCNTAIGKLGDNIEGLKRAIKYLQNGLVEYTKYLKPK